MGYSTDLAVVDTSLEINGCKMSKVIKKLTFLTIGSVKQWPQQLYCKVIQIILDINDICY